MSIARTRKTSRAASYADSLPAQLWLAEAQLDARNYAAADAAADRALAIAPDSSAAQYFKGAILLAQGQEDQSSFEKARSYFVRARNLDVHDPRPAIGYYLSYQETGQAIPEPAVIALEQVFKYSAYDPEYRMILARQLLWEDRATAAKNVLAPLAYAGHDAGDEEGASIGDVMEAIDAGKLDDARSKMAEIFKKIDEAKNGKASATLLPSASVPNVRGTRQ